MPCDGTVDQLGVLRHGVVVGGQGAWGKSLVEDLAEVFPYPVDLPQVIVYSVEPVFDGVLEAGEGEACGVRVGRCEKDGLVNDVGR